MKIQAVTIAYLYQRQLDRRQRLSEDNLFHWILLKPSLFAKSQLWFHHSPKILPSEFHKKSFYTNSPEQSFSIVISIYRHIHSFVISEGDGYITRARLGAIHEEVSASEARHAGLDTGSKHLHLFWHRWFLHIDLHHE